MLVFLPTAGAAFRAGAAARCRDARISAGAAFACGGMLPDARCRVAVMSAWQRLQRSMQAVPSIQPWTCSGCPGAWGAARDGEGPLPTACRPRRNLSESSRPPASASEIGGGFLLWVRRALRFRTACIVSAFFPRTEEGLRANCKKRSRRIAVAALAVLIRRQPRIGRHALRRSPYDSSSRDAALL